MQKDPLVSLSLLNSEGSDGVICPKAMGKKLLIIG